MFSNCSTKRGRSLLLKALIFLLFLYFSGWLASGILPWSSPQPSITTDSFQALHDIPSSLDNVLHSHPRLFAKQDKWLVLPSLIATDPYLASWHKTITQTAEDLYIEPPLEYEDGVPGSDILDIARHLQLRVKHWAYAYRISQDEQWAWRIWEELFVASGNSSRPFGLHGDNWGASHWLNVGEFLTAFAIAYDWLYDAWSEDQRQAIMYSMISLGLEKGLQAHLSDEWFLSVRSNWNCVTNGGMIVASLALFHEDPTGTAKQLLPLAIDNARKYCSRSVESDGTWAETPDYWYFGTQTHAQLSSALFTATGSTHGMLTASPAFRNTSLFHIYNNGFTEKFNYGDCGPAKITATANALFLYGRHYAEPLFTLYQRDKLEAADPLAVLWYDPEVTGSWWSDLPLDRSFDDPQGAWVSMRSSWTDPSGLFVAMKGGKNNGHSSHGNLDAGDFVIDALGERWAGELCQDNYLSKGYFDGEQQDSQRWLYYRCRTEGQNTIVLGSNNQVVDAEPRVRFESTELLPDNGQEQVLVESTAYWRANLTGSYNGTRVRRGLRLLDSREKVLIQDEIEQSDSSVQWRMHTRADINLRGEGRTAELSVGGKRLDITLQSPTTAQFGIQKATRSEYAPPLPQGVYDQDNGRVSVLTIDLQPGSHTVAVMFAPVVKGDVSAPMPEIVPLEQWTLKSHITSTY